MGKESLNMAIEEMVRISPILHRKLHRDLFRVVLEEVGIEIGPHHMMIMRRINESGTLSSTEIGETLSIAKSQMTHSIDRLIKLGMVEREHSREDRRKVNISITNKGRTTLERVDKSIYNRLRENMAVLSDEELEKLAECFRYIAGSFSKLR